MTAHHSLSEEEKALLKKYRRQVSLSVPVLFRSNMLQVRNRASAQNSRARKRQHAESLEEEVEPKSAQSVCFFHAVVLQVQKLKRANGELQREARALRERVGYLEGVLDARGVP